MKVDNGTYESNKRFMADADKFRFGADVRVFRKLVKYSGTVIESYYDASILSRSTRKSDGIVEFRVMTNNEGIMTFCICKTGERRQETEIGTYYTYFTEPTTTSPSILY